MTMYSQCPALIQRLLPLWCFVLELLLLVVLLHAGMQKRPRTVRYLPALLLVVTDLLRLNLQYCRVDLPLWLPVWILALLTGITGDRIYRNILWQRTHISAMSVKESFDTLPTGICFYDANGLIRLANPLMDSLCQQMLGKPLQNGVMFWEVLQTGTVLPSCQVVQRGENPIVRTYEGAVYSFTRYSSMQEGREVFEVVAAEVTEEYEKTLQLREKNAELQRINRRLRDYAENVTQMTREREILNAQMEIHDRMNRLLLTTRHCMEDGSSPEERKKMFALWHENMLLYGGQRDEGDPSTQLQEAAASIGLRLELQGALPKEKERLRVLMLAAGECMTNAVRHAGATALYIRLSPRTMEFTNNGAEPTVPVHEGGGLSAIRRSVSKLGDVQIETEPRFCVRITFWEGNP